MKLLKKILLIIVAFFALLIIGSFVYFEFAECGISPYRCGDYSMEKDFETEKITVGPGPEDMAIDTSQGFERIIVSCTERRRATNPEYGGFYGIHPNDHSTFEFTTVPSDLNIHPHGIDIVTIDSTPWLYAISHDLVEEKLVHRIFRFEIRKDSLILDEQNILEHPKMKAPNDLHVLNDGSLYATNYLDTISAYSQNLSALGARTGSLVYFDGKDSWEIVADDFCYPNGVWVNEEGSNLVLANGGCKEVLNFNVSENGALDTKNVKSTKAHDIEIPLGDNFVLDNQGRLWTTNHPCPLKFLGHKNNSASPSPIQVFKIDPTTLKSEMVYQNNGESISAASTAIFLNGNLYISQVFDPFVLVLKNIEG